MDNHEIKIRAFHKESRTMLDWFALTQTAFNNGGCSLLQEVLADPFQRYVRMQHTGINLPDSKRPIYEGDFLLRNGAEMGVVIMLQGIWTIRWRINRVMDEPLYRTLYAPKYPSEWEIIGNICANPEHFNDTEEKVHGWVDPYLIELHERLLKVG